MKWYQITKGASPLNNTRTFFFSYLVALLLSSSIFYFCFHQLTSPLAHLLLVVLTTLFFGFISVIIRHQGPFWFALAAPSYLTWMSTLLIFRPSHFSTTGWNLVPVIHSLALLQHLTMNKIIWYFGGNTMLFIPMGFILYRFTSSNCKTLLYGFSLMLSVEVVQGITGRGVFDIDDLILNLFGIWIGSYSGMYFKKTGKNHIDNKNVKNY